MKYSNPKLAELSEPAREGRSFLILLAGAGAILGALIGASLLASDWVAARIPFSAEQGILGSVASLAETDDEPETKDLAAVQALKALTARVAARMDLPPGMAITVHYVDAPTVNAMATLGGNVFVYRGLIEKLNSEDQLAAVLAHEIGHVRQRHVIRALSRGVTLVAALGAVGIKSRGINEWALGQGSRLTALSYSREAEKEADSAALHAVYGLYGNVGGVMELFALFSRLGGGGVEMLQSHPLGEHRLEDMAQLAAQHHYSTGGTPHPLPPALRVSAIGSASRNVPAGDRGSAPD